MNMLALTILLPLIGFVLLAFSRGTLVGKLIRHRGGRLGRPGGAGHGVCRR